VTSPNLAHTSPPDRLLSAAEVAERLSVPTSWVRAETRAERLPHVKLGRYRRYDWPTVSRWVADQQAGQWRKYAPKVPAT
jgi:excisionase family DNA binding protein